MRLSKQLNGLHESTEFILQHGNEYSRVKQLGGNFFVVLNNDLLPSSTFSKYFAFPLPKIGLGREEQVRKSTLMSIRRLKGPAFARGGERELC